MNTNGEMDEITIVAPAFTLSATPHWVAIDKGFFREEGINVTVEYALGRAKRWLGDMPPGKMVFDAPGGSAAFAAAREGRELMNICTTQDRAPHVLVARPEIKSVAELKGKRIMAGTQGASYVDARFALRHFGLDPDKDIAEWVASEEKPPDTERSRIESLRKGEIDAVCSGPPHWNMAEKMGCRLLPSARDLASWAFCGLTTTKKVIQDRPDVVKGVVRALIKGAEFTRMNKEETLDIVGRNCIYVDRDTLSGCYDQLRDQFIVTADEELHQRTIDVFSREYGLESKSVEDYYELGIVKEALKELRLDKGRG